MVGEQSTIRVEFFGIPRARAGVAETSLPVPGGQIEFQTLLALLAQRFPSLSADCFRHGIASQGFTASIDGQRFISRPDDCIAAGQTVLLFSADAGG